MSHKFILTEQEKNDILLRYYPEKKIIKEINLTFDDGSTKTIKTPNKTTTDKTTPETTTTTKGPKYVKPEDLPNVFQFQQWLDVNHPDWFVPTSSTSKSTDGIYGRQTKAAWEKYGEEFKKVLSGPGAGGVNLQAGVGGIKDYAKEFREKTRQFSFPQPNTSAEELKKPASQITTTDTKADMPKDLPREQEATAIISSLAAETAKQTLSYDTCVTLFKSVLGYRGAGRGTLPPDDMLKKGNPKAKGLKDTLQACLWQHNFGIGQGAVQIKKLYNLSSKGESK